MANRASKYIPRECSDVTAVLPAKQPLQNFVAKESSREKFSILSWNILLPNSLDNWWNHKMYASWVPMEKREWPHRQSLIRERLLLADADIVCIQEADGETFENDFAFMKEAGYLHCLHKKFRFRCATFFKENKFILERDAHKDRVLLTELRSINNSQILNVANCHLSGGAAPERRLRQVHEALEQLRKWKSKAVLALDTQRTSNRPSEKAVHRAEEYLRVIEKAGVIVCGDFNSDGQTGVRRLLVEGGVDPEWREPQYPAVLLTSARREHGLGTFADAAEQTYRANVCDGDYGETPTIGSRPATYVVPNLASLLLLPIQGEPILRTQFGHQVARGIADSLGLRVFSESEVKRAFESIDLDGNNIIDAEEVLELIESVYLTVYGRQPSEDERNIFFGGFRGLETGRKSYSGLSREQLTGNLMALQQELEGGSEGSELVEVRTEADAQRMIARFSPALKNSLDQVFDELSSGGEVLTEAEMNKFLLKVNEQLGRGGTARHAAVVFNKRKEAFQPAVLSRQEWYGVFARELGEGKWWQVVYDLEEFGAKLRPTTRGAANAPLKVCPHYQGWLDYVFFTTDQLSCAGVQESLTTSERSRVYDDGDALPNEWHPSDHLPVAAVFVWKQEP
jgi:mRNA deadenylase 3'-5' endonuclease subunit Ccr4